MAFLFAPTFPVALHRRPAFLPLRRAPLGRPPPYRTHHRLLPRSPFFAGARPSLPAAPPPPFISFTATAASLLAASAFAFSTSSTSPSAAGQPPSCTIHATECRYALPSPQERTPHLSPSRPLIDPVHADFSVRLTFFADPVLPPHRLHTWCLLAVACPKTHHACGLSRCKGGSLLLSSPSAAPLPSASPSFSSLAPRPGTTR